MELVIAGIVALGVRHLHSYEALEAANSAQLKAEAAQAAAMSQLQPGARSTNRAARTMHAQIGPLRHGLSNMVQGLLMFDDAGRLLVVNRRFCEIVRTDSRRSGHAGMSYDGYDGACWSPSATSAATTCNVIRERRAALISRTVA